jgi:hypothetical protein
MEDLPRVAVEQRWFATGLRAAKADHSLLVVPPPNGEEAAVEDWIERSRPSVEAGAELEPILPQELPMRHAAWVRSEETHAGLELVPGQSADSLLASLSLLPNLCKPGGHEGPWIALRGGAHQGLVWWMIGDVVHHACRLDGGESDFPLFERDVRALLEGPGPVGWETCPIALLEAERSPRLEAILREAGREVLVFPWNPKFAGVPEDLRFAAAAAVSSADDGVARTWDGPLTLDDADRRRAVRWAAGFLGVWALVLALWAVGGVLTATVSSQIEDAQATLQPESGWLASLDSAKRVAANNPGVSASRVFAELSRCLPAEAWIEEWSALGAPRKHEMVLKSPQEAGATAFQGCLDKTSLFGAFEVVSTEVGPSRANRADQGPQPGTRNLWTLRLRATEASP